MSFELMTYGLVTGLLYARSPWKCIIALCRALIGGMAAGRVVWGVVMTALMGPGHSQFTFSVFWAGAVVNAIPGMILQLTLIPGVMLALNRTGLIQFHRHSNPLPAQKA